MKYKILEPDDFDNRVEVLEQVEITESDFDAAYEKIFSKIQNSKITIKESGGTGAANVSMSQWVDPTPCIAVVFHDRLENVDCKSLVTIASNAIKELGDKYSILIHDHPTHVCVCPNELVIGTGSGEALSNFGF